MSNLRKGFRAVFIREWKTFFTRPIYMVGIVIIPLISFLFFSTLMWEGVPVRLPVGVVDLDHTSSSRSLIRNLNALSSVEVIADYESFGDGRKAFQENKIYAFMLIPENFERDAMSGKQPTLAFFSNEAYFVAGLFSFKALSTIGVLASASVAKQTLLAKGYYDNEIMPLLQPIVLEANPIGNPWLNYSIFLCSIMLPIMMELLIMIMTIYALGIEIKNKTSKRLLVLGDRSIIRVILGKLLPQTILFMLIGLFLLAFLYGYLHFPLHCSIWRLIGAMFAMIVASQCIGIFFFGIIPILRISMSLASLMGIIGFSIVGFSLPIYSMYGIMQILSNLYPARHYFMIYANGALEGMPVVYSLKHFMFLTLFVFPPMLLLWRIKKAYIKQEYIP
ncbi:MAG: ABC transporter permease [Marinifilaceae bacterium]